MFSRQNDAASRGAAKIGRRSWAIGASATALLACLAMPPAQSQTQGEKHPALKITYVPLARGTRGDALLVEPATLGPKSHIVLVTTHPEHVDNFGSFLGDAFGSRGYRVIAINDFNDEKNFEVLLPPIASAMRYARSLSGVDKVILVGHSSGGPEVAYYQDIAENGPAACQKPNRLLPCDGKGLTGLPKADGLMLLEANIGAPHRMLGLDPAVNTAHPKARDPKLDMYLPKNGYDPKTDGGTYSAGFLKRYFAGMEKRSSGLIAQAQTRLKAVIDRTGPYNDDEPFVVAGMSEFVTGARLNWADLSLQARTHGAHMLLKADGTRPVQIVQSVRTPGALPADQRDTLNGTTANTTVRHYLSYMALHMSPDFAMTGDDVKGMDWTSSANSAPGNVEGVTVPTLVMAGSCMIHLVPLEITYDHAAAKDKDYVVVEGGDHTFRPCRPEFGDTQNRAFDYVDSWLSKRF